jgi:MFS superfamily sulfate permease-like transporter
VLYRFAAPLFFANAKTFRDEVTTIARSDPPARWIMIAAEPITDVHTTAAVVLFDLDCLLDERLLAQRITVHDGTAGRSGPQLTSVSTLASVALVPAQPINHAERRDAAYRRALLRRSTSGHAH